MNVDSLRHLLYPLGYLASFLFGLRFYVQWFQSEKAGRTTVSKSFWVDLICSQCDLCDPWSHPAAAPPFVHSGDKRLDCAKKLGASQTQKALLSRSFCPGKFGSGRSMSALFLAKVVLSHL